MILINAFIWGALGGFSIEIFEYFQRFKNGDFENQDHPFKKLYFQPCIISSIFGGIVACAIISTPTESWAFIIGLGASGFISRFY